MNFTGKNAFYGDYKLKKKPIYVTKYCLTKGIVKLTDYEFSSDGQYCSVKSWYSLYVRIGQDAFFSTTEAIVRAEEMRDAKIASLKKQLSKLEKMTTFKVTEA